MVALKRCAGKLAGCHLQNVASDAALGERATLITWWVHNLSRSAHPRANERLCMTRSGRDGNDAADGTGLAGEARSETPRTT